MSKTTETGEFFRAMMPDKNGLPVLKRSARGLGVRSPEDVLPDALGNISPGTGGMSVAPSSVWSLPHHRRPQGMGRGSTGPSSDRVFGILEGKIREVSLTARPDPVCPHKHAFVEPATVVPLLAYEAALARTQQSWSKVWP